MAGKLTILTGPMASGKTLELTRLLKRREIAGAEVTVFKNEVDLRDGKNKSKSRLGPSMKAIPVKDSKGILDYYFALRQKPQRVVAIEEIHFFDDTAIDDVKDLLQAGADVYATCLNQDYRGEPFGAKEGRKIVPTLLALADDIVYLTSICPVCGQTATKTQRLVTAGDKLIQIGGDETYSPRCVNCWIRPNE